MEGVQSTFSFFTREKMASHFVPHTPTSLTSFIFFHALTIT